MRPALRRSPDGRPAVLAQLAGPRTRLPLAGRPLPGTARAAGADQPQNRLPELVVLFIRRTLAYALLTAALATLYLGSVIVLQFVLVTATERGQSPAATLASTLLIPARAELLRARIQRGIDRRFYRQRYDTAPTLAAYGTDLRGEVGTDLKGLKIGLVGVVQATLEPESIWLWLRS
jgi:hypothetical protein